MNVVAPALIRPKNYAAPSQTTELQREVRGKDSLTETSIKSDSCACGGGCPKCLRSLGIQAKLRIGAPNDKYEQEADRVAEQVMRMPEPKSQQPSQTDTNPGGIKSGLLTSKANVAVQRQADEEELIQTKPLVQPISPIIQRQTEEENNKDLIQTKTAAGLTSAVTPAIGAGIQSLRGGGQPLPKLERSFFEPRFGCKFNNVRIHTDSQANASAQALQARAFTYGNHIVFNRGQYDPRSQVGKKLLAHELTHVVQQEQVNLVQMSPIKSHWGLFDDEFYGVLSNSGRPGGVQIKMSFRPGIRVNASKIGFVQTARLVRKKRGVHFSGRNRREREIYQSRAITRNDDRAIDSSILRTDEGVAIDQMADHINPLYVVGQQDANNGRPTLSEGESQSPIVQVPFGTRDHLGFTGFRYDGYGQHGSREGPDDRPVEAIMQDRPTSMVRSDTINIEMLLETSALAVEGAQAGTYYGSVRWGWRVDGQGVFSKLPMTLVSMGAPSPSFLAAGEIWNRGFDVDDRSNIELPIPKILFIAPQSVPLFQNPDDSVLGIPPQGVLSPGTRVQQLGDTDDVMLRVRVVDCPPLRGYVDNLSGSFTATTEVSQATITRATPVFSQPQDMGLGIEPIGVLAHAQTVQVLGSDQMASMVTVNSCDLMGQEGYIDNLDQIGHQIERPSLSDPTTSGRTYMGPISTRHVVQGRLADCYLLASLISLSQTSEGQIQLRNSLRELEDDNFNVRLFTGGEGSNSAQERWIRVGPIQSSHRGAREIEGGAPDESRWVQAFELAYAQLRGRGEIADIGRTGVGGREIGGAQAALSSITGLEASRIRITADSNTDQLWQQMQRAVEFGQPLVAGTGSRQTPALGIYSGHNYSILALLGGNGGERFVRIRTPWANRFKPEDLSEGISNHPAFEIPFESFVENFIQVDFGSLASTASDSYPVSQSDSATSIAPPQGHENTVTDRLLVLQAATIERIRLARGATTNQSEIEELNRLEGRIPQMTADQLIAEYRRVRPISNTISSDGLRGGIDLQPSPTSPITDFRNGNITRSIYQQRLRNHQLFLLMEYIRRRSSPASRVIEIMLQHIGSGNIHWRAFPSMAANAATHTSGSEPPRITIILGEAMVLLLDRSRFSDMVIVLLEELYHAWDRVNEQARPRFSAEEMRDITQVLTVAQDIAEDAVRLTNRIETELYADLVQLSALHRETGRRSSGVNTRRGYTHLSNIPAPLRRTLRNRVSDLHRFLGSERGLRAAQQIITRAENETWVDATIVSLLRNLVRSEFLVD